MPDEHKTLEQRIADIEFNLKKLREEITNAYISWEGLAWNRSPWLRGLVILVFTAPAAYAGYSMVLQLSELGIPSPIWTLCESFAGLPPHYSSASLRLRLLPGGSRATTSRRLSPSNVGMARRVPSLASVAPIGAAAATRIH